jgi:hypothetical protein
MGSSPHAPAGSAARLAAAANRIPIFDNRRTNCIVRISKLQGDGRFFKVGQLNQTFRRSHKQKKR